MFRFRSSTAETQVMYVLSCTRVHVLLLAVNVVCTVVHTARGFEPSYNTYYSLNGRETTFIDLAIIASH